jgi:hypothetical protein
MLRLIVGATIAALLFVHALRGSQYGRTDVKPLAGGFAVLLATFASVPG